MAQQTARKGTRRTKTAPNDATTSSGKTTRSRRRIGTRRQRQNAQPTPQMQTIVQPVREASVRQKRKPAAAPVEAKPRRKPTLCISKGTANTEEKRAGASEDVPLHTQMQQVSISPRPSQPERTTCSTENIAAIRRVQDMGRIDTQFDYMKQAAKSLALHAANLTALGVIHIPENTTRINFDKNPTRNRYKDVLCADRERVVLKPPGTTDYIHANHIRGPPLNPEQRFICTQGPTASTILEFWRMVRQENVQAIVMLCETVELGKTKCYQYWPHIDGESMRLDAIGLVITNCGRFVHHPGFVTTVLELKNDKDILQVFHNHWKNWPDRGVPDRADTVLKVLQLVRACPNKSAVVIHCSAGVGRTGVFMAVEMGIQALIANRSVEMVELVRILRQKRMHCVQTDLQFAFIYKVLLSFISTKDPDPETSKALEDFLESFTTMVQNAKLAEQGILPVAESSGAPPSNS
ncbi:hypothetical protein M3Y96_00117800 [Aphelenchoides besseyi]|nr:hypothetical protein M3Y96_00117800 [Aphelenchoides besseyi]